MWKLRRLSKSAFDYACRPIKTTNVSPRSVGPLPYFCTNSSAFLRKRLEGKIAVITGGASGIGRASVKLFVEEGAKVIIADIQDELGQQLATTLEGNAEYLHCDVTKERDVSTIMDATVSKHGRLDIMFNNAGVGGPMTPAIAELDVQGFEELMAVNLRGVLLGTKHAARVMIPAKRGSIICTASITALVAGIAPHPYTISKHAVIGLVKSVAGELREHGIRVNCISPYAIATPIVVNALQKVVPTVTAESIAATMDKESGFFGAKFEPDDIARAAVFLASEEARYISGHNLVVDGGYSITKTFNPLEAAETTQP